MAKLTLDELKVESFAIQATEQELTSIKGGTSWPCIIYYGGAIIVAGIGAWAATSGKNEDYYWHHSETEIKSYYKNSQGGDSIVTVNTQTFQVTYQ